MRLYEVPPVIRVLLPPRRVRLPPDRTLTSVLGQAKMHLAPSGLTHSKVTSWPSPMTIDGDSFSSLSQLPVSGAKVLGQRQMVPEIAISPTAVRMLWSESYVLLHKPLQGSSSGKVTKVSSVGELLGAGAVGLLEGFEDGMLEGMSEGGLVTGIPVVGAGVVGAAVTCDATGAAVTSDGTGASVPTDGSGAAVTSDGTGAAVTSDGTGASVTATGARVAEATGAAVVGDGVPGVAVGDSVKSV